MTLGTIFKSVLGPEGSRYYDQPTGNKIFTDRNGGEYYHIGHHHHHKSSKKAEKKHAILSALSLLAFLFFLNILANCIREQTMTATPIMMFSQGKNQMTTEEYKRTEKRVRRTAGKDEGNEPTESPAPEPEAHRKSRTLLEVTRPPTRRQEKFIRHLKNPTNWTNELTQVSDKDLEDQKLKTLNFSLYWNNNKDPTQNLTTPDKTLSPILRRLKKRERLTTTPEPPRAVYPTQQPQSQKTTNFLQNHKMNPDEGESNQVVTEGNFQVSWLYNTHYGDVMNKTYTTTPRQAVLNSSTVEPHIVTPSPWRRSDAVPEEPSANYDRLNFQDVPTTPVPMYGLNLDTYQTYPMPYYNNQRLGSAYSVENQTFDVGTPTLVPDMKTSYNDLSITTPQLPPYYPKPMYSTQPYYTKYKYRNKHPNHKGFLQKRNEYPIRYRYSPYRRMGINNRHDNYYPVVVAARYPDDDGFDLMKLAWTMLTTLAQPLARLVPGLEKDSQDDYQCYDLIMCEAQRASKYMGPTAETLATTLGTMLTWAVTEETRQLIVDAIKSGKENTCQQQIKDCEDRSGGKSAMTIIAQLLEMKKT